MAGLRTPSIPRVVRGQRSISARGWNDLAEIAEGVMARGLQGFGGAANPFGIECVLLADSAADPTLADPMDYLSCTIADTGEALDILKPPLLRPSVTERAGISYTYSDAQSREADNGSETEDQVIVEAYQVGDLIVARPHITTGGVIVWMDTSARVWAKESST